MDPRHNYGVNVYGMKILIWIPRQAKKRVLGTFFILLLILTVNTFGHGESTPLILIGSP
jgi:hypothetical protein